MEKEIFFFNLFFLKCSDIFTITSKKPVIYFVSESADNSEQNSMRWIFLSRWRLRVPNFRTAPYVTRRQKCEGGGKGRESLRLLAYKVLRNSSCINLAHCIYKERRINRNEMLSKLYCRSYTNLILNHSISHPFYLF